MTIKNYNSIGNNKAETPQAEVSPRNYPCLPAGRQEPRGILKYLVLLMIILVTLGITTWAYFVFDGYIRPFFNHQETSPVVSETNKNQNSSQNLNQNQNQNLNLSKNANLNNNVNTAKGTQSSTEIPANEEDYDADGLTNIDEFLTYGTDPAKWDTDGDYYSDKEELDSGNNPQVKAETEAVADWNNYSSTELGISFRYPKDWSEPTSQESDQKYILALQKEANDPYSHFMSFVGYPQNYQTNEQEAFAYNGLALEDYCPDLLTYTKQGDVCRIIWANQNITQAVQKNYFFWDHGSIGLNSAVVFPNQQTEKYLGIVITFFLSDLNQRITAIYNQATEEATEGLTSNDPKMDIVYIETSQQSRNIINYQNLTQADSAKLNIVLRILQMVKFL